MFTDHLGNVRLSYKNTSTTGVALQIVEENNYYPFGLKHKGYNNTPLAGQRDHKYGFGGKEEQDELGLDWLDITARNYDPALGRWMNIDAFSEFYYSVSNYTYSINDPINNLDPNGHWVVNISQSTNSEGEISYSLNFTAEEDDDLDSLSKQLGLSNDQILEAHPELGDLNIVEGNSFGLSNIGGVKKINSILNVIGQNQDKWNCANFACGNDTEIAPQYISGGNTEEFKDLLTSGYNSVKEKNSSIGDVIHYRPTGSVAEIQQNFIDYEVQIWKSEGKSDAEIKVLISKTNLTMNSMVLAARVVANERHFSIVILKNTKGTKVENVIQKFGQIPFDYQIDNVNEGASPSGVEYAPEAIPGTSYPYYKKK